ncbi:MAG TPA: hypothetical protein VLS89_16730, partial [Candidatus Nanopelagicales bacterium]|nr:hypothetical protein [Candidatus Nanopelagicales bacterium]
MRRTLLASAVIALASSTFAPRADAATSLRANLIDPRIVKLDGIPKEWPGSMVRLGQAVKGHAGKA